MLVNDQLKRPTHIALSPQNSSLFFSHAQHVFIENKWHIKNGITYFDGKASHPFDLDLSPSYLKCSPDGEKVAFLGQKEKTRFLYLMDHKGNIEALTGTPSVIFGFQWSPDGKKIAFVAPISADPTRPLVLNEGDPKHLLWLYDLEKKTCQQFTDGSFHVRSVADFGFLTDEISFSPDGNTIAFSHSPKNDVHTYYHVASLSLIDLKKRVNSPLKSDFPLQEQPRFSPDGTKLAFITSGATVDVAMTRYVAIYDLKKDVIQTLSPTPNEGPRIADISLLGWTSNSKEVLYYEPYRTHYHLLALPINGEAPRQICDQKRMLTAIAVEKDRIAFIQESATEPPEVYTTSMDHFAPQKISALNPIDPLPFHTETITYLSKDGLEIEALVNYPKGYKKGEKYPTLLLIHGGPMGFWSQNYLGRETHYPLQEYLKRGYVIVRPNPRGSTGYGKSFRYANLRDWGGRDADDVLGAIDYLIDQGIADPDRLGILGWSYGGYLTLWIISQTDRFKVAAIGAAPTNLVSLAGSIDLPTLIPFYIGAEYWEEKLPYNDRSPIHLVDQINTPLLILHGTIDTRVPTTQSLELYYALQKKGKTAECILYPGMHHNTKDPNLLQDLMQRHLDWVENYLQPAYAKQK